MAFIGMEKLFSKYPNIKVLVIVPTTNLLTQWTEKLENFQYKNNITVMVINSAVLSEHTVDLIIIDEIHITAAPFFRQIFTCVHYKLILGLTATIERLDGLHVLIEKRCPVVDEITLYEAIVNNWLANFTEYQVLLDVDDIDVLKKINHDFLVHFEFFDFNFKKVQSLIGKNGFANRKEYTNSICTDNSKWNDIFKLVTHHAMGVMRTMRDRKKFLNNHPKKIEVARKIIEARPDAKILTFSNNVKMAESIKYGKVYSGADSKKHSETTLKEFMNVDSGVLNSVKKLVAGADIPNLNVEIILGHDSSKIRAVQTRGRVIRKEGDDKHAEIFNLVINESQECKWFQNSHSNSEYVTINEENLYKVLNHEPFETYRKPVRQFNYRF